MKFRNTFAVALLFLGLGAYLWWVERPKLEEEGKPKRVYDFKVEDVNKVTLAYPDRTIELAKTGAGWRIQKPMEVGADTTAVENLVRAITELELKRNLEGKPESLETYGLDKPAVVVSVGLASGEAVPAVRVGKTSPVGWSTFVQLEGREDVTLVPSAFWYGMKKEVVDLRDKTVLAFEDDEVQGLAISGGGQTTDIRRAGDKWTIGTPPAPADEGEVRAYLSSLRALRAEGFIDPPLELVDFGLDAPRRRVVLDLGDKGKQELLIGAEKSAGKKNVLYVKRADGDVLYAVGDWAWASLDKSASAFRDKIVLAFDREAVRKIEVGHAGGESYVLERTAEPAEPAEPAKEGAAPAPATWKVAGAEGSRSETITQLVSDLHSLKGYEMAAEMPTDLAAFGLAPPALTFTLQGEDGKTLGKILAGRKSGSGDDEADAAFAMAENGPVVLKIRDYVFSHLDKKRADLVETAASGDGKDAAE